MKASEAFKKMFPYLSPPDQPYAELPEKANELICHQGQTQVYCLNRPDAAYLTEPIQTRTMLRPSLQVYGLVNPRHTSCSVCPQTQSFASWVT